MNTRKKFLLACLLLASTVWLRYAQACPFCSAVSQTLTQEIAAADVAVIARLLKLPADPESDGPGGFDLDNLDSGMAEFEVLETIRDDDQAGNGAPAQGSTIKVVYFGSSKQKKKFLISGMAGKQIDWTTPLPLSERGIEYIKTLGTLPEKGPERLVFFLDYLEDEDPLLAQDAYDEFGRAPYDEVTAIGDQMDRQKLIGWIEDSQVGPTRRRLYLTMLGICGQPEDVEILESLINYNYQQMKPGIAAMLAVMGQTGPVVGVPVLNEMIKADVRRKQRCLDALIAAYLKLKGPAGLPLIEQRFLTNPAAEYTHVYAAVMALRFHGEETDALPRPRLLESVRLLLNNPEIADQVISDLARWEDWSVLDRLVAMFKDAEKDAWVRQPVISYLLAATEQSAEVAEQANAALAELEKLDPEGVKRARSYMSFGLLARAGGKKKSDKKSEKKSDRESAKKSGEATVASRPENKQTETDNDRSPQTSSLADARSTQSEPTPEAAVETATPPGPSRLMIIGGPLIAGLVLFGVFALLLRGADVRSSN